MDRKVGTEAVSVAPEDPDPCDHEWEFQDDSFDHEFGTEIVRYWICGKCGKSTYKNPGPSEEP